MYSRLLINRIFNDERFFIDDFNKDRVFGNDIKILKYEFVSIPIGKIYMEMEDRLYKIEETVVYNYLKDNHAGKQLYKEYCDKYGKKNPRRNVGSYDKLIHDLNIYDPKKGVIIINQYGLLFDGQHRVCILQKKYGKSYDIMVLRLVVSYPFKWKLKMLIKYIRMKLKK